MADCMTQQVTTEGASADAANAVAISSPHITQVRVPRRDDGRWMALGSMVGAILGKFVNKDQIDKAEEAEGVWRQLTDKMREVGEEEFTTHAQALRECTDGIWQAFCDYVLCGYKPDYSGILSRVRADAALVTVSKKAEACRTAKRYNVGVNANVMTDLLRAEILATVGAASAARESERQMMWKANTELLGNAAVRFEQAYLGRIDMGAKLMSSAGENYAYLAESLRRTAEKNVSDMAALGAALAIMLPVLFNTTGCPPDADCGCTEDPPPDPDPDPDPDPPPDP